MELPLYLRNPFSIKFDNIYNNINVYIYICPVLDASPSLQLSLKVGLFISNTRGHVLRLSYKIYFFSSQVKLTASQIYREICVPTTWPSQPAGLRSWCLLDLIWLKIALNATRSFHHFTILVNVSEMLLACTRNGH